MKLLSNIDSLNQSAVIEVIHDINSNHVDAQWKQPNNYPTILCKICSNLKPVPKPSVLMPSNVQIPRQVLLKDLKVSKEQRLLYTNYYRNITP